MTRTSPPCCTRAQRSCPPRSRRPRPQGLRGGISSPPSPPEMSWSCASAWPATTLLWATRSSSRKVCTPPLSPGRSVLHSRRRWSTGSGKRSIGHAVAISASMGAGIIEANRTGGTVKRIHCGWAAHSGVTAAELAARGLTGPPTAFEGRFGFLQAYLDDEADAEALTRGLGEQWEVTRTFFKPYPANHFTHAGIDAAISLREEGLDIEETRRDRAGRRQPCLAHDRPARRREGAVRKRVTPPSSAALSPWRPRSSEAVASVSPWTTSRTRTSRTP